MDENVVYFRNILPELQGIYLYEVWEKILRMIARRIHSTVLYPSDWKDFAAEIGINDPIALEDIEISATVQKEIPLCVAFCGPLRYNYTLYDVIQALINLQRADVLCLIREEFEDFWNEQTEKMLQRSARASSRGSSAITYNSLKVGLPKENPPLSSEDACLGDTSSKNEAETCNWESAEMHSATDHDYSRSENQKSDELNTTGGKKDSCKIEDSSPVEIINSLQHGIKLSDVNFIHCKPLKKSLSFGPEPALKVDSAVLQTNNCCPAVLRDDKHASAPARSSDPISVFVIYVGCETTTGIKFANKLRRHGLKVITISEAEFMIRIDRSGFLKTLLEKVDFVIPVICEEYMLCVRPDRIRNWNSNDGKTNRFIFTWLHSEYENNACFNFRVKPVVVENFDWNLIGNDPIFQWVHQLWNEVDNLVNILRDTKQMMSEFTELWNQEEFVEQWIKFLNSNF